MMKRISCFLLLIVISVCGNSIFVNSDTYDDASTAYIIFSSINPEVKDADVSIGPGSEISLYNEDGHSGWVLNEGETVKNSRIIIKLNDEFAFANTDGTSYTVEVDYLNVESGHFNLVYDAYDMTNKETKPTYIGNTGEWKTAVYELDDAYFGNRMNNGADLWIATYDETLKRSSTANVVISAVRIIKYNAKNFVQVLSVDTDAAGNIFGNCEEQKFTAEIINHTGETKHADVTFEAFDANNNIVWSYDCDTEVGGNDTKDVLAVCDVNKYGLYNFMVTVRGNDFKYSKTVPFSLVNNRLDGKKHSLFGYQSSFSSNVPGYEYDYKKALELYDKSGVSFIRTGMVWNKVDPVGKPKYTCEMTEQYKEIFDEIAKHKLDVTLNIGLYGPKKYDGLLSTTHMPITEDALKGYAEFCKFNALACKERGIKVLGYELWNEPEMRHFNKNATMQQVSEMVVDGSKALSEVDPDAPKKTSVSFCAGPYVETYTEGLSADGYADWCRALICHTYHNNSYPEDQRHVQYMRDYIKTYEETIGKKPEAALMTEYGRNRSFDKSKNPADKACLVTRDAVFIQKSGLFDKLSWYTLNTGGREDHGEDTYGDVASHNAAITDVPFAATESFVAKTNYNNLMCEAEYDRALADETTGINAYLFKRRDDYIMTVWTADRNNKYDVFSFKSEEESVNVRDIYGNSETVYSESGIFTIPVTGSIKYIEGNISDAEIPDSVYLFYEDFENQTINAAPINVYDVSSYSTRENNGLTSELAEISSETNDNKYLNILDNNDKLQNAVIYLNKPVSKGTVVLEFDGMIPNTAGVLYSCHKAVKAGFTSNSERSDSTQIGIMVHEGKDGGSAKDNSVALYHYNSEYAVGVRTDINYAAKESDPKDTVEFELGRWLHYRVEVDLDNNTERVWLDGVISGEQHNLKLENNKALDSFNFATTWKGRGAWFIDNIKVYKKNSMYASPFVGEISNYFGTIRADLIREVNADSMQIFDADGVQQEGTFNVENLKITFVPDNRYAMVKNGVYYIKIQQLADGTLPIQENRDFIYNTTATEAKISIENINFTKDSVIVPSIKINHDDGTSGMMIMFVAAYKERRLISLSQKIYPYGESDLTGAEAADGLSNVLPEDVDTIKVFVWDKDNLNTICSAYTARK